MEGQLLEGMPYAEEEVEAKLVRFETLAAERPANVPLVAEPPEAEYADIP